MRRLPFVALLVAACGTGPLPTARIDLQPSSLCEGDDEQSIILSGARSVAADGTREGRTFEWTLSSTPTETVRGAAGEEEWVVRFNARHPVQVALSVADETGRVGTREKLLPLVRSTLASCTAGCPAHQICVGVGGTPACVDELECAGDDECGCYRCQMDDLGQFRCLP